MAGEAGAAAGEESAELGGDAGLLRMNSSIVVSSAARSAAWAAGSRMGGARPGWRSWPGLRDDGGCGDVAVGGDGEVDGAAAGDDAVGLGEFRLGGGEADL